MANLRFGTRVHIRKRAEHPHPTYKANSREQEIGAEPMPVLWSPYYLDLKKEGAIEIVESENHDDLG